MLIQDKIEQLLKVLFLFFIFHSFSIISILILLIFLSRVNFCFIAQGIQRKYVVYNSYQETSSYSSPISFNHHPP